MDIDPIHFAHQSFKIHCLFKLLVNLVLQYSRYLKKSFLVNIYLTYIVDLLFLTDNLSLSEGGFH